MTSELIDSPADYLIASVSPGSTYAEIQEHCEGHDDKKQTFFEECLSSGRPYIEFAPQHKIIRYVYFNRSQPPTAELMKQLVALGWSFGLMHHHVLDGDIYEDCLDTTRAIAYQGRFTGPCNEWSPERAQSFITKLSQLLPSFDRQAEIKSLVEGAISTGYFTVTGMWPFGDEELEDDARVAHVNWCRDNERPCLEVWMDDCFVSYEVFGRVLNERAESAIDSLARSVGLKGEHRSDGASILQSIGGGVTPIFRHPEQMRSFFGRLREILSDSRSHVPNRE
jgi:hypothetical protein